MADELRAMEDSTDATMIMTMMVAVEDRIGSRLKRDETSWLAIVAGL